MVVSSACMKKATATSHGSSGLGAPVTHLCSSPAGSRALPGKGFRAEGLSPPRAIRVSICAGRAPPAAQHAVETSLPMALVFTAQPTLLRMRLHFRLALAAAWLFLEKAFLDLFVDYGAIARAEGLGAALRVSQHWGFRFLVSFAIATVLF